MYRFVFVFAVLAALCCATVSQACDVTTAAVVAPSFAPSYCNQSVAPAVVAAPLLVQSYAIPSVAIVATPFVAVEQVHFSHAHVSHRSVSVSKTVVRSR